MYSDSGKKGILYDKVVGILIETLRVPELFRVSSWSTG